MGSSSSSWNAISSSTSIDMSMGRSNIDLPSSKLTGPCFDDLKEVREAAEGFGMIEEACPSAVEGLSRERERMPGEESHAERLSLNLLSVALPDSAEVHLSHVQ